DSPRALAILDEALRLAWREPAHADEAEAWIWVCVNRGYHLFRLGRITEALEAYEAAHAWYKRYPAPDFEALEYLYLPLGAHYTRLGDNPKAQILYREALERFGGAGSAARMAGVYNNLALSLWNSGDNRAALVALAQAPSPGILPPAKSGLLALTRARCLFDLDSLEAARQSLASALSFLTKKEASQEEGLSDYLSGAHLLKARLLERGGHWDMALESAARALRLAADATPRDRAKIETLRARLLRQKGQAHAALRAADRALRVLLPALPPDSLPAPADLYAENALFETLSEMADALADCYAAEPKPEYLRRSLACHQLAFAAERLLLEALQYESAQIDLLTHTRRRSAKAMKLARLHYETTRSETALLSAWAIAEQAKATLLAEALQRNLYLSADSAQQMRERQLLGRIAYFERMLLDRPDSPQSVIWARQRDELLGERKKLRRKTAASFKAPETDELRRFLNGRPERVSVEFFADEDSLQVFAHYRGQYLWLNIAPKEPLMSRVAALTDLLHDRNALSQNRTAFAVGSHGLYATLLKPLLDSLRPAPGAPLWIVPESRLAGLPFEALLLRPDSAATWSDMSWLLERHPIGYAYSFLAEEAQSRLPGGADKGLLHIAPRFEDRRRNLAPLLHSETETPAAQLAHSVYCADACAAFERLAPQLGAYRMIHLSTHASAAGPAPHIEWSDRRVFLPEIYALHLRADLLALSACETAAGEWSEGEGVMSLARAFTAAGAKGLAATLWPVNEQSSALIFSNFYEALRADGRKCHALYQAKIRYLSDPKIPAFQKTPYYWAGIVYTGDDTPLRFPGGGQMRLRVLWIGLLALLLGGGAWMLSRKRFKSATRLS
ncbi:MAG: CHAT domain-containing protein, partial [Saprospiraceae bacterium]